MMQKALHEQNHVYMLVNFMNCANLRIVSLKFLQIHLFPCYGFTAPWICIMTDMILTFPAHLTCIKHSAIQGSYFIG